MEKNKNFRKPLPKREPHYCPKCGMEMGLITHNVKDYYCCECGLEVKIRGDSYRVYSIDELGILRPISV